MVMTVTQRTAHVQLSGPTTPIGTETARLYVRVGFSRAPLPGSQPQQQPLRHKKPSAKGRGLCKQPAVSSNYSALGIT